MPNDPNVMPNPSNPPELPPLTESPTPVGDPGKAKPPAAPKPDEPSTRPPEPTQTPGCGGLGRSDQESMPL